eukprot:CAMPEP_0119134994 /NCGR_PEP_ID=MMETSP1310-20130426/18424_1 /TAXON_ID=464262 /ORGANISM="Genus nov. species nov., Strain RCC2339" /LENGTH=43 /DNA_ID= /DNA_START= /DNA_END= /DNA_ORIENTATION=
MGESGVKKLEFEKEGGDESLPPPPTPMNTERARNVLLLPASAS